MCVHVFPADDATVYGREGSLLLIIPKVRRIFKFGRPQVEWPARKRFCTSTPHGNIRSLPLTARVL